MISARSSSSNLGKYGVEVCLVKGLAVTDDRRHMADERSELARPMHNLQVDGWYPS
jgi:hypothetical protein